MLTPKITSSLPLEWQGAYSVDRTREWIAARDDESVNLLVAERQSHNVVGLMLLFETEAASGDDVDVRLGYLLAESAWGQGLASELVQGFVHWCRGQAVSSIESGVGRNNHASRRVLEKNGFEALVSKPTQDELFFRLTLAP
jgi:RimJ/RimL family protein N-acetyltransferase